MDNTENKDNNNYNQQKEILSSRMRSGRRTYFFDLKSSRTNISYHHRKQTLLR